MSVSKKDRKATISISTGSGMTKIAVVLGAKG